jgi:acetyl-CoA/propionyl-CoA carboxylase carboxyl transferase subunit
MTAVASPPGPVVAGPRLDDPRDPVPRLRALFDDGTTGLVHLPDSSGVVVAHGRVDGAKVIAYCTDARRLGGALGADGCGRIVDAIETAARLRAPVVALWHSGGARLAEGVTSLDGVGRVFAAMVRASGRVPQVSVVLGAAAGGAAYGSALTDLVVTSPAGRVFVTGPDVIRSVTGELVDQETLGGPAAHGRKSGVVHVVAESEADAMLRTRRLTGFFTHPGAFDTRAATRRPDLRALLPERRQRAYDVRPLVRRLLDGHGVPPGDELVELQPKWAPNVVVGFGRLAGRAVGVIANNPLRLGGCLDSESAEKAARFVRLCDAFGVPLVVLVDVPGYLPGVDQEWGGIVRRGAKLLHAFAEASVPRVTLVTRKAFGGAYVAMNSRALGATAVYAWPQAQVAVMGARAAVGILQRRQLAAAADDDREALHDLLAQEHERTTGGLGRALDIGVVDAVIDPADTRRHLVEALAGSAGGRGAHANIPL